MIPGKKKVFHIIQSLDNGGCENMLLRTLPLVDELEHTVITLKEVGELAPRFATVNIRVVNINCKGLFDIPGLLRLRTFVKQENPDLVISYLFHADMASRFVLSLSPVPFLRTTYNHPKYFIARFLEWLTKPLVKGYLANSAAVKRFYIHHLGVNSEKINVLPNGIDLNQFSSLTKDSRTRESLGISPNDTVIICVANLHPNKGHRFLLEAFEKTYQKHTNLKLLIVGAGEERSNLEEQIATYRSKNHILFLGKRTDIPVLLQSSDIFVLPTFFEGMSNALMEAMAAGLPVITTDIEENRELVTHHKTGLLIPVKDSQALEKALNELLKNRTLRTQLSSQAKEYIQAHFSLDKIAKDWNKLLGEYTQS